MSDQSAKKRERTTVSFTGDEIIRALYPLIVERLEGVAPKCPVELVQTRWTQRPVEYTSDKPVPLGCSPMTTDVMFTLEWDAP